MATGNEWIGKWCATGKSFGVMRANDKYVDFAAATTGEVDAKELFEVRGTVIALAFGVCSTGLNSAGSPTIQLGTENATDHFIAATSATGIDDGEVWDSTSPGAEKAWSTLDAKWAIINGADIGYEVKVAAVTSGNITFYCYWFPLSEGADVVTAGADVDL